MTSTTTSLVASRSSSGVHGAGASSRRVRDQCTTSQPNAANSVAADRPTGPMPTTPTRLPASSRPPSAVCGHDPARTAASASTVRRSSARVAETHHSATLVVLAPAQFATGTPAEVQAATSMPSTPTLGCCTKHTRGPGSSSRSDGDQSPRTTSTSGSSRATASCVRSVGRDDLDDVAAVRHEQVDRHGVRDGREREHPPGGAHAPSPGGAVGPRPNSDAAAILVESDHVG
jgi:hypothetical protein